MRKRFTRLLRLDHMFYAQEAPILISGGTLLRDEESGNLLCQITLHSLSEKEIRMVQVAVQMLDAEGNILGKEILHRYTDLTLDQDEETGSKTAIVLPAAETASFRARATRVDFADGRTWEGGSSRWRKLPRQQTLPEYFGDENTAAQFQVRYGNDCRFAVLETSPLWFCVCGAANPTGEKRCRRCRRNLSAFRDLDEAALKRESARRVEQEQFRDIEEEAEKRSRRRGVGRFFGVLAMLALIAAGLYFFRPQLGALFAGRGAQDGEISASVTAKPAEDDPRQADYDAALKLIEEQDFDAAKAAFLALGDYGDSAEMAASGVDYARALWLMELGRKNDETKLSAIGRSEADLTEEVSASMLYYAAAQEAFEELGDYKDCAEQAAACGEAAENAQHTLLARRYADAEDLLAEKSYSLAREAFLALGDYEDSAEQAAEAVYRKAGALKALAETEHFPALYVSFAMDPEQDTLLILSEEDGQAVGGELVPLLQEACGKDRCNVVFQEPGETPEIREALAAVYEGLGAYKDSAALAEELRSVEAIAADTDELKKFFAEGDLAGAQAFLERQSNDYPDKALWLERIKLYLPFADNWSLVYGDPTVFPLTVGVDVNCYEFTSKVYFEETQAKLVLSGGEGDKTYTVEFTADYGQTLFLRLEEIYYYNVSIAGNGDMAYVKLLNDGSYRSSCQYEPAK